MRAFRRRILALALLLLPLTATGCFEVGELAVENRTNGDITLWSFQVPCDFDGFSDERRANDLQKTLSPGESETVFYFDTDLVDVEHCIAIAGPEFRPGIRRLDLNNPSLGDVLTYEVERGTTYAITGQWPAVQISAAGPHDEEFTYDFHISTTMALIIGAPFALGALASLWITVKFFVDFGKRPYLGVS